MSEGGNGVFMIRCTCRLPHFPLATLFPSVLQISLIIVDCYFWLGWQSSLLNANKVTITAALGFDSFLVMCHGAGPLSNTTDESKGEEMLVGQKARLGCYFCNDVVALVDSTTNRTLDQQCTVTRPGLAPIASALAVELLVGILHHPLGISANAEFGNSLDSSGKSESEQPLGIVPHQICGALSQFSQMIIVGHFSNSCTACCTTVVSEYLEKGSGICSRSH